jgi:hypothetical protein
VGVVGGADTMAATGAVVAAAGVAVVVVVGSVGAVAAIRVVAERRFSWVSQEFAAFASGGAALRARY